MSYSFGTYGTFSGSGIAGALSNGKLTASDLYNEDALDSRYDYQDAKEAHEIEYTGRDAALDSKISNICTYIEQGREDKAMAAYQELLDEISSQGRYEQIAENETQLKALAREMIESNLEDGTSLEDFIKSNTANCFERGFEINWDGDQYQEEDLLKEMCDLDTTTSTDGLKKAGGTACKVLGGAGAVAAGIAVGSAVCAPIGIIVGLGALALNIFRK